MIPNIFDYATSELSQDAFLLWLGKWADSEYTDDADLHNIAVEFISALIHKQMPDYTKSIEKVEVWKQWEKIDVCYTINNEILIIIEDKTGTGAHDRQLTRYKYLSQDWCDDNDYYAPICIYFKSEDESLKLLHETQQLDYAIFTRLELLEILRKYQSTNNILIDYRQNLEKIESQANEYLTKSYKEWSYRAWCGFYLLLQREFSDGHWSYVANPSGGFVGYWWNFIEVDNINVYLQIEQGNLCFKVGEVYKDHSEIRNQFSSKILSFAKEHGYGEIKRPARFGRGTYMTVAEVAAESYIADSVELTIQNLRKYMELLNQVFRS